MKRIVCIGNRYRPEDNAGPLVYDHLQAHGVPSGVKLIDAGLAGLDLLRFIEGARRVVFVDAVLGLTRPDEIVLLTGEETARYCDGVYDHIAGLPYVLRVLPEVCDAPPAELFLVGIEGRPSADTIAAAAEVACTVAATGRPGGRAPQPMLHGGPA